MSEQMLILVNEDDEAIGTLPKEECHLGDGILHRAFSIFIYNDQGEVLIQRRGAKKMLWPGYWSNACCSHPHLSENLSHAIHRCLKHELGINCELSFLYKFIYKSRFNEVGTEHELCSVWRGDCSSIISPHESEIMESRFIPPLELDREIKHSPEIFTPWLILEWEEIQKNYSGDR